MTDNRKAEHHRAFAEAAVVFAKRTWAFVRYGVRGIEDVAYDYMMEVHRGQRFKYISGDYAQHPIAVAAQQVTSMRRTKGYLHDTVEDPVAKLMKALKLCENAGLAREIEESARQNEFKRIKHFFASRGYEAPDVKALSRYSWESRAQSTARLLLEGDEDDAAVKLADALHNRLARRNLPPEQQTPKIQRRLGEYDSEISQIRTARPDIHLKPIPEKDPEPKSTSGNPVNLRNLGRVFSLFL